jgi:hypothetical protein
MFQGEPSVLQVEAARSSSKFSLSQLHPEQGRKKFFELRGLKQKYFVLFLQHTE